jgi:hypothetical protein
MQDAPHLNLLEDDSFVRIKKVASGRSSHPERGPVVQRRAGSDVRAAMSLVGHERRI